MAIPLDRHRRRERQAAITSWRHLSNARCHLDARHLGVSLVRSLGPGLPLHPVGAGRSGLCQGAARCCCLREWYMHPNGQLPAYEWAFGDVNPPVHAWAAWRVYKHEKAQHAAYGGLRFPGAHLPQAAAQLHLVGESQRQRRAITSFKAGSWDWTTSASSTAARPCQTGGHLEQSDGTAWMGMYCLTMLADGPGTGQP